MEMIFLTARAYISMLINKNFIFLLFFPVVFLIGWFHDLYINDSRDFICTASLIKNSVINKADLFSGSVILYLDHNGFGQIDFFGDIKAQSVPAFYHVQRKYQLSYTKNTKNSLFINTTAHDYHPTDNTPNKYFKENLFDIEEGKSHMIFIESYRNIRFIMEDPETPLFACVVK